MAGVMSLNVEDTLELGPEPEPSRIPGRCVSRDVITMEVNLAREIGKDVKPHLITFPSSNFLDASDWHAVFDADLGEGCRVRLSFGR